MPSMRTLRIQPGTGNIAFSTSKTTINAPNPATAPSTTTHTTLTLTTPSGGVALFDSLTQSNQSNNNVTLALRNLIGGNNISISYSNEMITISSNGVDGPGIRTYLLGVPTGSFIDDSSVFLSITDGIVKWLPAALIGGTPSTTSNIELEDASGFVLLEDNSGFMVQEL